MRISLFRIKKKKRKRLLFWIKKKKKEIDLIMLSQKKNINIRKIEVRFICGTSGKLTLLLLIVLGKYKTCALITLWPNPRPSHQSLLLFKRPHLSSSSLVSYIKSLLLSVWWSLLVLIIMFYQVFFFKFCFVLFLVLFLCFIFDFRSLL